LVSKDSSNVPSVFHVLHEFFFPRKDFERKRKSLERDGLSEEFRIQDPIINVI